MNTPDNSQIGGNEVRMGMGSRHHISWKDQINTLPKMPKGIPGSLGRAEIKEAQDLEARKERIESVNRISKYVAGAVVAAVIGGASLPHDGSAKPEGQNQPAVSSSSR